MICFRYVIVNTVLKVITRMMMMMMMIIMTMTMIIIIIIIIIKYNKFSL